MSNGLFSSSGTISAIGLFDAGSAALPAGGDCSQLLGMYPRYLSASATPSSSLSTSW
jgi:hypothetical protein